MNTYSFEYYIHGVRYVSDDILAPRQSIAEERLRTAIGTDVEPVRLLRESLEEGILEVSTPEFTEGVVSTTTVLRDGWGAVLFQMADRRGPGLHVYLHPRTARELSASLREAADVAERLGLKDRPAPSPAPVTWTPKRNEVVRWRGSEMLYRVRDMTADDAELLHISGKGEPVWAPLEDLYRPVLLPGEESPSERDLEGVESNLERARRNLRLEAKNLRTELTFTQKELDAVRRERSAQARELEALRQQTPLTAEIEEKLKQASWLFEKAQAELEEERAWTKLARKERDLARVREQEARAELGRLQDDSRRGEDDYLFPPVRRFARALHAAVEKAAEVSRPLGLGESEARLVQRVGRLLAERPANAAEAVPDMVIDIAVTCLDLYDAIQERISRSAQGSP